MIEIKKIERKTFLKEAERERENGQKSNIMILVLSLVS